MKLPDLHRIPNVSPLWWGAIASAAAAGAILFPDARIVGGTVAGGALLVLALYKTPCCASCADAAKATPTVATREAPAAAFDISHLVGGYRVPAPALVSAGSTPSGCAS